MTKQYLELLNKIKTEGEWKRNRTGVDTISISGHMYEHDMSEGFPLITTKKVYTRAVLGELEFFMNGITDKNWLRDKKIHIWDDWCTAKKMSKKYSLDPQNIESEFLDIYNNTRKNLNSENVHKRFAPMVEGVDSYFEKKSEDKYVFKKSLTKGDLERLSSTRNENGDSTGIGLVEIFGMYAERDLGPIYGFQWRNFGAEYEGYDKDYSKKGVDQFAKNIVGKLKSNPKDRRMIVSAWNPVQFDEMALPPCHYGFQVLVNPDTNKLDLLWNQRSVDTFLGLPFNIASYAALLHLLAKEGGFEEGKLRGMLADVHLYENHLDQVEEQLSRTPKKLPKIVTPEFNSIFDWKHEDTKIIGYESYPPIAGAVAV